MPRLISFILCQLVTLDSETFAPSLIGVISGISVIKYEPADDDFRADPYPNVELPWSVAAIWHGLPEDQDRQFEQKIVIFDPDEHPLGSSIHQFNFEDRLRICVTFRGRAFPVTTLGVYNVRLSYREIAANRDWKEVASYPILISQGDEEEMDLSGADEN